MKKLVQIETFFIRFFKEILMTVRPAEYQQVIGKMEESLTSRLRRKEEPLNMNPNMYEILRNFNEDMKLLGPKEKKQSVVISSFKKSANKMREESQD